jgi:hypothetical protein
MYTIQDLRQKSSDSGQHVDCPVEKKFSTGSWPEYHLVGELIPLSVTYARRLSITRSTSAEISMP